MPHQVTSGHMRSRSHQVASDHQYMACVCNTVPIVFVRIERCSGISGLYSGGANLYTAVSLNRRALSASGWKAIQNSLPPSSWLKTSVAAPSTSRRIGSKATFFKASYCLGFPRTFIQPLSKYTAFCRIGRSCHLPSLACSTCVLCCRKKTQV